MLNDVCIRDLAEALGGHLRFGSMPPLGGDLEPLGRVVTTSSEVATGDVLWMLDGAADGASCVEEAYARGAQGVVVAGRQVEPWAGKFSVQVEDATWALWQFTRWVRARFAGQMIAVAGGIECRTAQALIGRFLKQSLVGVSRTNSRQDLTGFMLNLLHAEAADDFHVGEIGAGDFSEIDAEMHLCRPNIAVITGVTNVFRPDADAVFELESRCSAVLSALPADGWAILDGDVPWLRHAAQGTPANVLWVGRGSDCNVVASSIRDSNGALSFTIDGQLFQAPALARHQLSTVLAAYAVARVMKVTAAHVREVLGSAEWRGATGGETSIGNWNVINDSSRSSLLVSCAGFERLREARTAGQRIAVCTGSVPDPAESPLARQIAEAVVTTAGADFLVVCGKTAANLASAAADAGVAPHRVLACSDVKEAATAVQSLAREGDTILVHGGETENQHVIDSLRELASQNASTGDATPSGPVFLPAGDNLSEVLPLGSILREVDATLPPG